MGIKVELRQGKRWWYVVADFGDGRPVSKGPMAEDEARKLAADLQEQAARMDGVKLREKSAEEERADRMVGYAVVASLGAVVVSALAYLFLS